MFSHKAFLKLGDFSGTDFLSLTQTGYELANCNYVFQQGIDEKGKASTEVYGGSISLTLPMLPPVVIVEWALNSWKYKNGVVVVLDDENMTQEKIMFENAACVSLDIDYTQKGKSYVFTRVEIRAERIILGNGVDFDNNWVK